MAVQRAVPHARQPKSEECDMIKPNLHASVYRAAGVRLVGDVTVAADCSLWYNAVLRGDLRSIRVGEKTNIQDCCVLHTDARHELSVGSGCTVGHGAVLHGCQVGDNTLIGMGSVVLSGAKIGSGCIVGAGSLVTGHMDAPDGSLILGSPARVVRPLTEEEIESNRFSCRQYMQLAQKAKKEEENA
jgi:carbonic anhydrase/acetyltransferase-like protein (isoleucine patch superfamily)